MRISVGEMTDSSTSRRRESSIWIEGVVVPVGECRFVLLLDFLAPGVASSGGVVVEPVDGVAGGDDGGWFVDRCERFANRLAEAVVVGWGSEADAEDGDLFGQGHRSRSVMGTPTEWSDCSQMVVRVRGS